MIEKITEKFDLEDRLIEFTLRIMEIVEELPKTKVGNYIADRLVLCGTSPALNYGEIKSTKSRKDFVLHLKIMLKELRETYVCLRIIKQKPLLRPSPKFESIIKECNELILISTSCIDTAHEIKLA